MLRLWVKLQIIDRGIRTPEQILEWYVDKIVTRRSPF